MKKIILDGLEISNEDKICFFAGLNILETAEQTLEVAFNLRDICSSLETVSYTHLTLPTSYAV